MHRLASLFVVLVFAGCASSSGSSDPASSNPSSSGGAGSGDGGADATSSSADIAACDGATADGILGTWSNEQMAGGDGPNGIVMVKVTYRFCGTATGGTYRYQEDGLDTPTKGCRRVADLRGTFTLEGTKLLLTLKGGYSSTESCPDPSGNYRQDATPAEYPNEYEAKVEGDQLTLTWIGHGQVANSSPYVYERTTD